MFNRHFAFWPKGQPRQMSIPQTALFYNVEVSARRFPDKPCPVFCDKQISFAGFKDERAGHHRLGPRENGRLQDATRIVEFVETLPKFATGNPQGVCRSF